MTYRGYRMRLRWLQTSRVLISMMRPCSIRKRRLIGPSAEKRRRLPRIHALRTRKVRSLIHPRDEWCWRTAMGSSGPIRVQTFRYPSLRLRLSPRPGLCSGMPGMRCSANLHGWPQRNRSGRRQPDEPFAAWAHVKWRPSEYRWCLTKRWLGACSQTCVVPFPATVSTSGPRSFSISLVRRLRPIS